MESSIEVFIEFVAIAYILFGMAILIKAHFIKYGTNDDDSISIDLKMDRIKRWIEGVVNYENR